MPPSPEGAPGAGPRVAILLSTFNGARFLQAQLDSFVAQTHQDWTLHWRDDGSTDQTVALMRRFAGAAGQGRCVEHTHLAGNVGVLASYMALLRAATPTLGEADVAAFADQDDVWLPQKLDRALVALAWQAGPALTCARYTAVDADLRRLGDSARLRAPTAFPAALTQNVATGCTIVMNRAAARLVGASQPPAGSLHDWWSYIVVTAGGGQLLRDETPLVLYRQHGGNAVGVAPTAAARARAAARRGPGRFMTLLRGHVAALAATPDLLAPDARARVTALAAALRARGPGRLAVLRTPGLRRQGLWETLVLRAWILLG